MKNWKDYFYRKYVTSGQSGYQSAQINSEKDLHRPYAKYIVKNFFPENKDISILDIGCGYGAFLYTASKEGYKNLEGIDISIEQISIAKNFGLDYCKLENIFTTISSYEQESRDIVMLLDVLEHCTKDQIIDLIFNIKNILKKDGLLFIHVPNAEGIFGSKIRYADFTHEIAFTAKSAFQLLGIANFKNVRCYEDKPLIFSLFSAVRYFLWQILTLPFRLLHLVETGDSNVILSQNLLIIAVK